MASKKVWVGLMGSFAAMIMANAPAAQQQQKPNIILILSDDFGYGDSGPYGGGENRGMPTPSLDRLAAEGMQFMSFYAQPSCTPGRAAMQTGAPSEATLTGRGNGSGVVHNSVTTVTPGLCPCGRDAR